MADLVKDGSNEEFPTTDMIVPVTEYNRLVRDAKRWRAFLSSARIRLWGWAGFEGQEGHDPDSPHRHFGGEFWTTHPATTSNPEQTRGVLEGYVDAIVNTHQECAKCGQFYQCGAEQGKSTCWCFELPPSALPVGDGVKCLCPSCLKDARTPKKV